MVVKTRVVQRESLVCLVVIHKVAERLGAMVHVGLTHDIAGVGSHLSCFLFFSHCIEINKVILVHLLRMALTVVKSALRYNKPGIGVALRPLDHISILIDLVVTSIRVRL